MHSMAGLSPFFVFGIVFLVRVLMGTVAVSIAIRLSERFPRDFGRLLDWMVPETTALLGDAVVSIGGKWSLGWHGNDGEFLSCMFCVLDGIRPGLRIA